jgi:hypothetical protein
MAPAALAAADWSAVVAQAQAHHLAAALHARLQRTGSLPQVPEDARSALAQAWQAGGFDLLVWRRALGLVLPALAAEGIEPIPYKGAALAFLAYEDPAARPMSDIDLWIAAPDMARACAALERLGFERREKRERPLALQSRYDGEVPYAGHRIGVPLVELHWGVFPGEWLQRTTAIDREALRARSRPASLLGHPVRVLAPEDHLIQVAVHAAVTHVYSQAALRCLLDLVVIARGGIDWPVVVARAREWRLARIVGHALQLTGDLFAQPDFAAAAHQLLGARRLARLYRQVDPATLLAQRKLDAGLPKWRYLTSAVDRPRERWSLLARSLWPEEEWLGARYGRGGARVRVGHLARALRGRF